jgi:hypothetical protein
MSETPRQPQPAPAVDAVHADAEGNLYQHGIPIHATDEEPTGLPNSDRHLSETAPHEEGGDAEAPKHQHEAP